MPNLIFYEVGTDSKGYETRGILPLCWRICTPLVCVRFRARTPCLRPYVTRPCLAFLILHFSFLILHFSYVSWYILYSTDPLAARQRCEDYKSMYEEATGRSFSLQLRTPNEYVGDEAVSRRLLSQSARDYLFRYVFAKAEIQQLDDFLHFEPFRLLAKGLDLRLVNRRTDGNSIQADRVSEAEIDHFFRFCKAYSRYAQNRNIPFFELSPEEAQTGDWAIVTDGQYKDMRVRIATDQDRVGEGERRVDVIMMDNIVVRMTLPTDQLRMLRPRKYLHGKYALYDEFFDHFSTGTAFERFSNHAPSTDDMARALRMKAIALDGIDEQRRAYRDSRRLRYLRLSALIVAYMLLDFEAERRALIPEWRELRALQTTPERDSSINLLLANYIPSQS